MANEAEIAGRTDLIAKAMVATQNTMRDVLNGLGEADRTIGGHLADVQRLAVDAWQVRGAERRAERVGEIAHSTRNARAMDQWTDADTHVRQTFKSSQIAAGELSPRIGSGQRDLEELRDKLAYSSSKLDDAIKHLDALDQLPEYAGSEQSTGLRNRLNQLKAIAARADAGISITVARLTVARRAAAEFEVGEVEIGEFRHSIAVEVTRKSLSNTVTEARDGMRGVGNDIYAERTRVDQATQFGIASANEGRAAKQTAELAAAICAAGNPTPDSAHVEPGSSERDLRRRLDGASHDSDLGRQ